MAIGKEGRAINEGNGQAMCLKRLTGIIALLALACCDAPPRGASGPIIDTLPSGLRVVTNVPPWLDGSTHGLIQATEDLRIGTALSGGPEEFGALSGLEVDGEGRIYVSDAFNTEIRVFHPDGAFSHAFGKRGEGPGELGLPHGILVDLQGRLWVRDLRNMRFSLFGRDGTFLEVRPIRHRTVGGTLERGIRPLGPSSGLGRAPSVHDPARWKCELGRTGPEQDGGDVLAPEVPGGRFPPGHLASSAV